MPSSFCLRPLAGLSLLPLLLAAQTPAPDPSCRPADPPAVCQQLAAQVAVLDDATTKAVWDELLATARLAERYPKSPGAWLALAQARRAAHELRMKALRGPRQTAGESFAIGAGNALIRPWNSTAPMPRRRKRWLGCRCRRTAPTGSRAGRRCSGSMSACCRRPAWRRPPAYSER